MSSSDATPDPTARPAEGAVGRPAGVVVVLPTYQEADNLAWIVGRLLDALAEHDLVIGSRWVPGGTVTHWPWHRRALSRGGNLYVRLLLGLPVRDATAGFRVFRAEALRRLDLDGVRSVGYVFQTDLAARAVRAGLRVGEVPVDFVERVRGQSKMDLGVAVESLRMITRWGVRERVEQVRSAPRGGRGAARGTTAAPTPAGRA